MEIRSVSPTCSLNLLNSAWCAKDLVITRVTLACNNQIRPVASPADRGCGLPLLQVVDAALGDASLVELGLTAIPTVIV